MSGAPIAAIVATGSRLAPIELGGTRRPIGEVERAFVRAAAWSPRYLPVRAT